jgi:hypothetical protein
VDARRADFIENHSTVSPAENAANLTLKRKNALAVDHHQSIKR